MVDPHRLRRYMKIHVVLVPQPPGHGHWLQNDETASGRMTLFLFLLNAAASAGITNRAGECGRTLDFA